MTTSEKNIKSKIIGYLLEIIIIIVGILGAFGLENWRDQNKRSAKQYEVLKQVYFELEDNLEDLENDLVIHRTGLFSHMRVVDWLDKNITFQDTMIFDFYWLKKEEYIFPNTVGYENLKTQGIDLISNDTIRNLIALVYNHNFPRLVKGNTLYPDISTFLDPYYQEHFITNRDTSLPYQLKIKEGIVLEYPRPLATPDRTIYEFIGFLPLDKEELQRDEEFRYLLSQVLSFRIYKVYFYSHCISNVKQLMAVMEREFGFKERRGEYLY